MLLPKIDWKYGGEAQRRKLYRVAKSLVDRGAITWPDFYSQVFKSEAARLGPGFQNNFSTGKISARNASLVYEFLSTEYPDDTAAQFPPLSDSDRPGIRRWLDALEGAFIEPNELNFDFLRFVPITRFEPEHVDNIETMRWAHAPEFTDHNTREISRIRPYGVQIMPYMTGEATGLYSEGGDWFLHWYGQPVENATPVWMGSEEGTPLCRPITFKSGPASYVLIIASPEVAREIFARARWPFPFRDEDLNRFPDIIAFSQKPWTVLRRSINLVG